MDNPYMRQPDEKELRAMLFANATVLTVYFAAIRATPLVLDFGYAAYNHYFARLSDKEVIADLAATDTKEQPKSLFEDKLKKVLASGRAEHQDRLTITDKVVGNIHYDADSVLLFLVITAQSYPQRTAFQLLSEARSEFEKEFRTELGQARTSGFLKAAKPLFKRLMSKYEDVGKADKIANVSLQVDEIKGVMQNNIQTALKNQENLETLLDTSDAMRNEASAFNRSTVQAKERMRWKSMKLTVLLVLLVLALVLIVALPMVLTKQGTSASTHQ